MAYHRSTYSIDPTSPVDLDVEGAPIESDYDYGWSDNFSAKPNQMALGEAVSLHARWALKGLEDACGWREAWRLMTDVPDIRLPVLKCLLLNFLALSSVFAFDLLVLPALPFEDHSKAFVRVRVGHAKHVDTHVGMLYNIFWLYPCVGISYYLASTWSVTVAQTVYSVKVGQRAPPAVYHGLLPRVVSESYRVILILSYLVICYLLNLIPFLGPVLSFAFMSIVDAYYCFEQVWIGKGWDLQKRMRYVESRWAYFAAFGLPCTAISWFHPSPIVNLVLFSLVFPICIIAATASKPYPLSPVPFAAPPASRAANRSPPVPTSPPRPLPPFLPSRLPVFYPTVKVHAFIVRALRSVGGPRSYASATPSLSAGGGPAGAGGRVWRPPPNQSSSIDASSLGVVKEERNPSYGVGSPSGVEFGAPPGSGITRRRGGYL